MKYKIEISEVRKDGKKINCIILSPCLSIKDAAFWQRRMMTLLPKNHIATVLVAK